MTIRYIVAPSWEEMPTLRGCSANERNPCTFTYKDFPGMHFPTIVTSACPRSGNYVAACQNWCEGHFGPLDPQAVAKEALDGLATVKPFPSPGRFLHAWHFERAPIHHKIALFASCMVSASPW